MNIVQITPGAGGMYCGLCARDNALVAALRKLGHQVLMVPLYLPFTLDEEDQSRGTPIFFSGINVYLEQKSALFRAAPGWFHDLLASPGLLKWAGSQAAKTRPEDLGELTLSMLRGEEGNQTRELDHLLDFLKTQTPPDVICLSTVLLVGLARQLKAGLGAPVTCGLQGEDAFLEALPEPHRSQCWQTIAERAADVDVFLAPSRYFGDLMGKRMSLPAGRVQVLPNGINLEGYEPNGNQPAAGESRPPVLGYFARMCKEKGLDTLVAAYIEVRRRNRVKNLKLRVGGSCGPSDEPFVKALTGDLQKAGLAGEVEFHRNVSRAKKQELLASFSVFSVPAGYGEAFGLYVIEALAAGAPVVQPRTGAFPELVESTGGGVLCAADDSKALADALEGLLLEPARLAALGAAGRRAVLEKFSAEAMARATLEVFGNLRSSNAVVAGPRS